MSSGSRGQHLLASYDVAEASASEPISRPASAASMRVRVDKKEAISARALYTHVPTGFEDDALLDTFARRGGAAPFAQPTLYSRVRLLTTQTASNLLSAVFLSVVVMWALSVRLLSILSTLLEPKTEVKRDWDDPARWKKEKLVKDVRYYAQSCGFEIQNETVETEDGYKLRMHRVIDPTHVKHPDGRGGYPVLIQHGLFQSSGSFVTSEERSLAFWLARQGGFQVFLGNNRGVFDMGHRQYKRSDPRFWDYNIRELAIYDLPAMVEWVCKETGYDKLAYIGHSQGNATMFVALSEGMVPELGKRLSSFTALAPAVYTGPLTKCFPFTIFGDLEWRSWKRYFGVLDFIPVMRLSYDYVPALPFSLLGYEMFATLFDWTSAEWLPRRKAKQFRFTPQPSSSASIFWWAGKGGFAQRGCILDEGLDRWWTEDFPPLALHYGGLDFLVLTEPLLERIRDREDHVKLLRADRYPTFQHLDMFWAVDAVEQCFVPILQDIQSTCQDKAVGLEPDSV